MLGDAFLDGGAARQEAVPLKFALRRDVMQACQRGIEEMTTVAEAEALRRTGGGGGDVPLSPPDFKLEERRVLTRHGGAAALEDPVEFTFVDYAPLCFHSLRLASGIEPAVHRAIFAAFDVDDDMCEKFGDGGRSGSFFYFTAEKEYIVKTLTPADFATLMDMLPQYYDHLTAHRDSLIARFYGLHGIRMHVGAKLIRFVVMDNVLLTHRAIDEVFDVKGSWVDRGPTPQRDGQDEPPRPASPQFCDLREPTSGFEREGTTPFERQASKKRGGVLKDLDLVGRKRIVVGGSVRGLLLDQIERDCAFFARHNIMDYSLLVGCHRAGFGQAPELPPRAATEPPLGSPARAYSAASLYVGAKGYLPPRLMQKLERTMTSQTSGRLWDVPDVPDSPLPPAAAAAGAEVVAVQGAGRRGEPAFRRCGQPASDAQQPTAGEAEAVELPPAADACG
eukprot:gene705-1125_t